MYPAPPRNLRVVSNTSSSIYLQWRVPRALEHFPGGLHQRVLYQCEYGPKEWKLAGILCVHDECELDKKMSFNLTGLPHAHALCDIRVSLRSGSAAKQDLESMWSANASITVHVGSTGNFFFKQDLCPGPMMLDGTPPNLFVLYLKINVV